MSLKELLVIVGDGHGASTPGKRTPKFSNGTFIHEHEFNQPTATKLVTLLKYNGFSATNITQGNRDVPLAERVTLIEDAKKKHLYLYPNGKVIFISIHYNAMSENWSSVSGIEVFNHYGSIEGSRLARSVHSELIKGTHQINRGVKEAGFYMLKKTSMPAILVEAGFMSNKTEAGYMLDQSFQYEVAKEIFDGVVKYFDAKTTVAPLIVKTPLAKPMGYEKMRFAGHSDVHIWRSKTPPSVLLGVRNKLERLSTIATQTKGCISATNCGMFPFNGAREHYGLLITDNGNREKSVKDYYQNSSPNYVDMIGWKDGSITVERVNDHTIDVKRLVNFQQNAHFAIGTSWSIINNGERDFTNHDNIGFEHSRSSHNRTMLGYDDKNKVWYGIVVDGRTASNKGINVNEQYTLGKLLGITHMCNLDGGGSSAMWLSGKGIVSKNGTRLIGTVIGWF